MDLTFEVEIDHGRITSSCEKATKGISAKRVQLPIIRGDGRRLINPTAEQLDASAWDDLPSISCSIHFRN
jgi:hypothetical protein